MYDFEFQGVEYELTEWNLNPAEPENGIPDQWVELTGWKRTDGGCPDFVDQPTEERFIMAAQEYLIDMLDTEASDREEARR